jgi:hypothetical protein
MNQGATYTYTRPDQTALVRFINRTEALGRRLEPRAVSLDPEVLMKGARRRTRLSDFGEESFRDPLDAYLAGLQDDANLTYFGRRLAHAGVMDSLCRRLLIQRELKQHPETLDAPVPRPIIIVGPPRTGTTLLNHLLAQDPASRPLRTWEALWPVPLQSLDSWLPDPRRVQCALLVYFANRWVIPDWNRIHPFSRDGPEECAFLLSHTFVNAPMMSLRTYREWFRRQPDEVFENTYSEYRQILQLLHCQEPARGHWVLKSPVHFWALDSLMNAVPEASIIHTYRHMTTVLPSYCSLQSVFLSLYTQELDPKRMGPVMMEIAVEAMERFKRARTRVKPGRILDLDYSELIADPIAAVRRIYDELSYEFTPEFEEKLAGYLSRDRKSGRPAHQYTPQQFGLDESTVSEAFADYHEQYKIHE